jgi:hypothetical protein
LTSVTDAATFLVHLKSQGLWKSKDFPITCDLVFAGNSVVPKVLDLGAGVTVGAIAAIRPNDLRTLGRSALSHVAKIACEAGDSLSELGKTAVETAAVNTAMSHLLGGESYTAENQGYVTSSLEGMISNPMDTILAGVFNSRD